MPTLQKPAPILLGWREWLALPELGIAGLKAKVDTGARSSALHVDTFEELIRDGLPWARFRVRTGETGTRGVECLAPVVDRRRVTDSGGQTTERCFIRTVLLLAGLRFSAEINLTDRRDMLFPMLLGRSALRRRFRVDPARSWTCPLPPRAGDAPP